MQTTQAPFVRKRHRLARRSEIARLLVFYACDHLNGPEKVDAHLATCSSCAQQPREEQEIHTTLLTSFEAAGPIDAFGELLAQCRSELLNLLDDFSVPPIHGHASPSG